MSTVLKSAEIFDKMNAIMKMHGSDIVKRVQSTYLFEIKPNKEADPVMFTLDLKNGQGNYFILTYHSRKNLRREARVYRYNFRNVRFRFYGSGLRKNQS